MKTAVEWLCEKYHLKKDIEIVKEAMEMEKHQLECAWYSSNENMKFQFSSSAYKPITFKQWLENFKEE
jgi:hypothetical protein